MGYSFSPIKSVRSWFTGVLPLVYDEALSYYEQISKFTDKLNEVISTTNELGESLASIVGGGKDYYINVTNPGGNFKALVGDGNTDNTEAFQALANIENAVLFFPAGVYATKSVTCKCDIVGAGALNTQILCLNDNSTKAGIIMTGNSNIYHIGINGNKGGQSEQKACLSLNDGGMAFGVRCYNGIIGSTIDGDNCEFMGQVERCTTTVKLTGNRNLVILAEDINGVVNSGHNSNIITNYRFQILPDTFSATADTVNINSNKSTTVKGSTVGITATNGATVNGDTVGITATNGASVSGRTVSAVASNAIGLIGDNTVTIASNNVSITSTNPLKYRTPTTFNSYFDYVPITGTDNKEYRVLIATDKTGNIAGGNNVTTYGATGDGKADDTQAIKDALSDNSGKSVYFPAGTYLISSTITIPDHTTIYGDGASSVIKASTSFSGECMLTTRIYTTAVNNEDYGYITIKDLAIDGSAATDYTASLADNSNFTGNWDGLKIGGFAATFLNVSVYNIPNTGVELSNNRTSGYSMPRGEVFFSDVSIKYCGYHGLHLENGSHDGEYVNCIIATNSIKSHNSYSNLVVSGNNANGRFTNCHFFADYGNYKPQFSVLLEDGGALSRFTSCDIEGAANANLSCGASNSMFINCNLYAAFGNTLGYLASPCTFVGCLFGGKAGEASGNLPQLFTFRDITSTPLNDICIKSCVICDGRSPIFSYIPGTNVNHWTIDVTGSSTVNPLDTSVIPDSWVVSWNGSFPTAKFSK